MFWLIFGLGLLYLYNNKQTQNIKEEDQKINDILTSNIDCQYNDL